MDVQEFTDGWKHFCDCIDWGRSNLDAEAIQFMNEMPASVIKTMAACARILLEFNKDGEFLQTVNGQYGPESAIGQIHAAIAKATT